MSELILTATDRLARALREDQSLARRAEGRAVWEAPNVRSLRQWLADVWADSWPEAQLINSTQSLALWLNAVERERHGVIGALACAREAMEAERLLFAYQLDPARLPVYSDEHRAWQSWQRRVASQRRVRGWIVGDQLPELVARGLREGTIAAPSRLRLAGFSATPLPAEQLVLDALAERSEIEIVAAPAATSQREAVRSADAEAQCRFIADTVRLRLAARSDAASLPPRIVIVLPDAESLRVPLQDALSDRVAPWLRRDDAGSAVPWRWDRGRPLAEQPWSEAALAVLALQVQGNEPLAVSRLLLSPLLWPGVLRDEAAALDARLRELALPRYSLQRLTENARGALREPLHRLQDCIARTPKRLPASGWAMQFRERLDLLGWGTAADTGSAAYQAQREFLRELSRLAALDAQVGVIDAARARLWLSELLKRRFEPRAEHAQPVLILAPEDAVGVPCDLLIVADADAASFPGPARASAFLAIETQRAAGMPQASPQAWLAHQRVVVGSLLAGADQVLLLTTIVDERGGEVLASPLFEANWLDAPDHAIKTVAEQLASKPQLLALPAQDLVPPVGEGETIRADARLFQLFDEAPFFAFCTHRLGVAPLRAYPRGIDASVQGKLLHAALEQVWGRLNDSAALLALDADGMQQSIAQALLPLVERELHQADYGRMLVQLETARLSDLLRQWLQHEARRTDAFRVAEREFKLHGELGGLILNLRIDRIDRVQTADGERLLILDYKTGVDADPKGWNSDSLREPQLPLYAVLLLQARSERITRVDGIAFAHLKDGHPALAMRSNWALKLIESSPAVDQHWPEQLQAWQQQLTSVARGFLDGVAGIDVPSIKPRSFNRGLLALAGRELVEDGDEDPA